MDATTNFYLICWQNMTEEEKYFEWSLWCEQMYAMDYSEWCDEVDKLAVNV